MRAGVSRDTVSKHLAQKKYNAQLMGGMSIQGLIASAAPLVTSSFESDLKSRNKRLAECSMLVRIKDDSAVGRSEALPRGGSLLPPAFSFRLLVLPFSS